MLWKPLLFLLKCRRIEEMSSELSPLERVGICLAPPYWNFWDFHKMNFPDGFQVWTLLYHFSEVDQCQTINCLSGMSSKTCSNRSFS